MVHSGAEQRLSIKNALWQGALVLQEDVTNPPIESTNDGVPGMAVCIRVRRNFQRLRVKHAGTSHE